MTEADNAISKQDAITKYAQAWGGMGGNVVPLFDFCIGAPIGGGNSVARFPLGLKPDQDFAREWVEMRAAIQYGYVYHRWAWVGHRIAAMIANDVCERWRSWNT